MCTLPKHECVTLKECIKSCYLHINHWAQERGCIFFPAGFGCVRNMDGWMDVVN